VMKSCRRGGTELRSADKKTISIGKRGACVTPAIKSTGCGLESAQGEVERVAVSEPPEKVPGDSAITTGQVLPQIEGKDSQ